MDKEMLGMRRIVVHCPTPSSDTQGSVEVGQTERAPLLPQGRQGSRPDDRRFRGLFSGLTYLLTFTALYYRPERAAEVTERAASSRAFKRGESDRASASRAWMTDQRVQRVDIIQK